MKDAGERGSLHIATKVVERVAEHACNSVEGTARSGGGVDKALGRNYPRIDAEVAGDRALLELEVSAQWPVSVPDLTTRVARHVTEEVERCAGVRVDRIDVRVGHVSTSQATKIRRVS